MDLQNGHTRIGGHRATRIVQWPYGDLLAVLYRYESGFVWTCKDGHIRIGGHRAIRIVQRSCGDFPDALHPAKNVFIYLDNAATS